MVLLAFIFMFFVILGFFSLIQILGYFGLMLGSLRLFREKRDVNRAINRVLGEFFIYFSGFIAFSSISA